MIDDKYKIRLAHSDDKDAIWSILEPVFREGLTYPIDIDVSRADGLHYWFGPDKIVYVCHNKDTNEIVGTYHIRPNSTGPASHTCNCGYATHPRARGLGVATALFAHSVKIGQEANYKGMQFNLVVSTNTVAVHLWQKLGMKIIGTTPNAFRLPDGHYTDAHIMHRPL